MPRRLLGETKMLPAKELGTRYPEIADLLRGRHLAFPITTKAQFVEQMVAGGERIMFGGVSHDTRLGAGLIPEFFFPIESAEDLIGKVAELLISRGLVSLPDSTTAPTAPGVPA
jgi:hypothetical protein